MERKEAIEIVKSNLPDSIFTVTALREALETLIPELAESEDELMRKEAISIIKQYNIICEREGDKCHTADRVIAWLEKQGEQKSVSKVEPFDEYEGLTDFERTLADICIGWIGQELGWKQYIKDNADVLLKIAIKRFNSVQDTIFEQKPTGITDKLKEEYQKGWDDAMQKLPKEVDSQIWQIANNAAKTWEESFSILYATQKAYDKGKKDALKEQKPAWSEEDENYKDALIGLINEIKSQPLKRLEDWDSYLNWIKSLRPHKQWKPSDEQITWLYRAADDASKDSRMKQVLNNLLSDLKKLREK